MFCVCVCVPALLTESADVSTCDREGEREEGGALSSKVLQIFSDNQTKALMFLYFQKLLSASINTSRFVLCKERKEKSITETEWDQETRSEPPLPPSFSLNSCFICETGSLGKDMNLKEFLQERNPDVKSVSPLTCLSSFCCMRLEPSPSMALERQKRNPDKTSQPAFYH